MHPNFNKFAADYKTFDELAEYARQRARISANRRSPQDFEYWHSTMLWANSELFYAGTGNTERLHGMIQARSEVLVNPLATVAECARAHAQMIHLRRMLINQGERVAPLSLDWLRKAALSMEAQS